MAILNSLIVSGASRFLNTAYFQDVSISGTATLSSLSLSGNLSVTGTSTLSGNTTVGGTLGVTGAATFNNWITTANNYGWKSAYGGGWYMNGPNYIRSYGKPVLMDHNMYFGTAGDTGYYVKTTGAAKFASVVAPTGSIATLNSDNVSVSNNLHATNFDLQTVAQLGGSFYVSPTVKFPNSGTKLAVSKSSTQLTLTIKDSSISTSTMAGIVWTANSAVKVSGTINGVVTGTMDGTIDSITNGSQMVVKVSGGNWNSVSATSTDLTSSQFSDLTVMVYQRHDGSNDYRVGIWMNCYDLVNSSSTIRVYGGTSSTPNVTIGNLTGSTFNGETISGNNNWGILTTMGYFEGAIVSTEGQIGGWTIGDTKLYHNTNSITSTDAGLYLGTDGIRNYSSGTQYVNITSGKITALGVDVSGKITATSGAIGGFDITSTAIKTKDVAVTSNADNSISLSSADFTRTINGTSRAGLRFAIGDKFGVTGDGIIYAGSANISGTLTAGNGSKIGDLTIANGKLSVPAANITGTLSADHIDTSSITIGQSQVDGLSTALGNKANSSTVTALSNKVTAVYGTCDTAANTQVKNVTCSNFEYYDGALITVAFSTANTYNVSTIRLNVNSKGQKNIKVANVITAADNCLLWGAGAVITFRYDGDYFVVVGEPRTWYGASTTAANTYVKTDTTAVAGCVVCKGTVVSLSMQHDNTATTPFLNIAGTGNIELYAGNGTTRPLTSNGLGWTAGSTAQFIFDGQYWRVGDTAGLARAYSAQSTANTANTNATNAAKTATNYLTDITNDGVFVHESNGNNVTPSTVGANGVHISDEVDIIRNGEIVATYGEKIRLGKQAVAHSEFDEDSFTLFDMNHRIFAHLGGTNELVHLTSVMEIDKASDFENYTTPCYVFPLYTISGISIPAERIVAVTSAELLKKNEGGYDTIPLVESEDYDVNGNVVTLLNEPVYYHDRLRVYVDISAMGDNTPFYTLGTRRTGSNNTSLTGIGDYSMAEGYNSYAQGNYSHAEGYTTDADGTASHAEGYAAGAYAMGAHAEGYGCNAGNWMYAEERRGDHAEGYMATANGGGGSHAEGYRSSAYGFASHAQNEYTETWARAQTVLGTFNEVDPSGSTIHPSGNLEYRQNAVIIGNGTDGDNRSNALTVDWSGNVWAAGKVMAANTSYVGMIIMSTTLDTMAKVISVYGGTTWIQHSGYFLYGASSGVTANHAVADGGEAYHTLTINEMPSHSHKVRYTGGYVNGFYGGMPGTSVDATPGYNDLLVAYEGGGQAHNNMPPYKNVYIWERTA